MKTDEYVYRSSGMYRSIHGTVSTLHACLLLSNFQKIHVHVHVCDTTCDTLYMYMYMYVILYTYLVHVTIVNPGEHSNGTLKYLLLIQVTIEMAR